ncbi:transcriptional regulator [Oceanicola sp. 22II-s10i]|uniref:MarR family winged helix-turn-helix transcriptional regulator n=1 Tax=Oceanicola sp. 22II-s10i TaxID=1317116 RepID=UPI000B52869E|nr:MarR family transcriptional regulator [Oceanicola sp. 22II-s10i]OWU82894.1 transcriptional regulator [Oceanicola sp. 22II-s10i]
MTQQPPYRLHDSLGYRLSIASRQQERRLDDSLRGLGLTRITWCVLLAVGNEGLTQPSDIADFVGIDRTATSRALRQMEAAGLVARDTGDGDRRTRRVQLTAAGTTALTEGTPLARANGAALAARLSDAEHAQLKSLLDKLVQGDSRGLKHL